MGRGQECGLPSHGFCAVTLLNDWAARTGLITCPKPLQSRLYGRRGGMDYGAVLIRKIDNGHFDISRWSHARL